MQIRNLHCNKILCYLHPQFMFLAVLSGKIAHYIIYRQIEVVIATSNCFSATSERG